MNRHRRAGPIDEQLFPGAVLLPQHYILLLFPAPVQHAETAIAVSLGIRLPVLFPQQLQRHMLVPPQLFVHLGKVRKRLSRLAVLG